MKDELRRTIVTFASIACLCLAPACGGDDGVSPDPDDGNGAPANTPAIPVPSSPGDMLPDRSDILILDEATIIDFAPGSTHVPDVISTDPWVIVGTSDGRLTLVENGQIVDPVSMPVRFCINPQCDGYIEVWQSCCGLAAAPVVHHVRYWQLIFSTVIDYPANYTESHTYTEGTSETTCESFSYTLGVSGSTSWIGLSAELTRTFSHSVTVSSETSVTKEFSCESIEGERIVFSAWQLVDGFRICNADSSEYDDPTFNHLVIPEIDNATSTLYMSVVRFD